MSDTTETARQYCLGDLAIWLRRLGKQETDAMVQDSFRECADDCEHAAEELARLRDEHAKLLRFARLNLSEWPDTESFEIQEAAKSAGLAVGIEYAKPCSDDCACESFYGQDEFPKTCYRLADFVRAP